MREEISKSILHALNFKHLSISHVYRMPFNFRRNPKSERLNLTRKRSKKLDEKYVVRIRLSKSRFRLVVLLGIKAKTTSQAKINNPRLDVKLSYLNYSLHLHPENFLLAR